MADNVAEAAKSGASGRARKKLSRRWHPRGFTGCPMCRKRHVKCDETTPNCNNCIRLGLRCDGYEVKVMFKSYTGAVAKKAGTSRLRTHGKAEIGHVEAQPTNEIKIVSPEPREGEKSIVTYTASRESNSVTNTTDRMGSRMNSGYHLLLTQPTSLSSPDTRYYSHFLGTVSTILIVWDTPYNSNPFRLAFPSLSQSSWAMTEAMKALGALHLANVTSGQEKRLHSQNAMSIYGSIMRELRQASTTSLCQVRLADLATNLLLCFFEMIDSHSQTSSWKVHLLGARHVYKQLFDPNTCDPLTDESRSFELAHPLRRFLVSLMAYLDVAGACATGDGTLLQGPYWDIHGGGWEYNLGVPSFAQVLPEADGPLLAQIRYSWSRLMAIQADISLFAKARREGLSPRRQQIMCNDLDTRLKNWAISLPECFRQLDDLDNANEDSENWQILEAMGSVIVYEQGTVIYLHNIAASGQLRPSAPPKAVSEAVEKILSLTKKFCNGIVQLGMLWPLFIAGIELTNPAEQEYVRQKFSDTARYGSMNVRKALDILEHHWLSNKRCGDTPRIYNMDLQNSILLP